MYRRDFIRVAAFTGLGLGLNSSEALARFALLTPADSAYDARKQDYFEKMRNFDRQHPGDVFLDAAQLPLLQACVERLGRLESVVGHGIFHLISFDDALRYARNYPRIGAYTRPEIDFLEMVFYQDARRYGFLGDKALTDLTHAIVRSQVVRIAGTGSFLHRGVSLTTYQRMRKALGNRVVMTSGVRNIMKQHMLFLSRVHRDSGNLSLASRQIAPPGYSYHGRNDFDVGQAGFGAANFSEKFADTDTYRRLDDLGLLKLRYPQENLLGVRYEPWHIMVPAGA